MILTVVILAALVRVINLDQSFWLDETIGLLAAKNYNLLDLLTLFPRGDNHPPVYYLLLKVWGGVFGYTEVPVRLLSVGFGVLTVFLTYQIAKELFPKKRNIAIVSSLFLATSPLAIYYSQEARMYTLLGFAVALSIYLFLQVIKKETYLMWGLFCLSLMSVVFIDYVGFFLLPAFIIFSLYLKRGKSFLAKLFIIYLILGIVFLLWLPIFATQAKGSGWFLSVLPEWKKLSGGANLKELALLWIKFVIGRISFFDNKIYGLYILFASFPVFGSLMLAALRRERNTNIVASWLVVPVAGGFLFSYLIPAFTYFRFIYVLPAFCILVAYGLEKFKKVSLFVVLYILLVNAFSFYLYLSNKDFWREDWRSAASYVKENIKEDELALFEFPEPFAPFRWYANSVSSAGGLSSLKADDKTPERVLEILKNKNGVWYFVYLKDLTDPENLLYRTVTENGFREYSTKGFPGVGNVIYLKKVR